MTFKFKPEDALLKIIIRKAKAEEENQVMAIVTEQDLGYDHLKYDSFWVATDNYEVLSVLRMEEFADFFFISAVGTRTIYQNRGYAGKLITTLLAKGGKDIYLYTIIPDFFARFGFTAISTPPFLPSRSLFACERCDRGKCACMIYSHFK